VLLERKVCEKVWLELIVCDNVWLENKYCNLNRIVSVSLVLL